jgi:DNA-binding XRE family transcriptional regulator
MMNKVKWLREELDLTQEALAWVAGVSIRTVVRAERDLTLLKRTTKRRLAKALGVTYQELERAHEDSRA